MRPKTIKTSELEGAALDWAVAEAVNGFEGLSHWSAVTYGGYSPSTDWSQGGPLIERFQIMTKSSASGTWIAYIPVPKKDGYLDWIKTSGQSPLIAACRAIVAAKLGDEVDVPEGLV